MKKTLFFILLVVSIISAQENVKFSAQIRPRYIIDNRDFNNDIALNTFGEMRTRVGMEFQTHENLSVFFQVQDSRTFGEEDGTISDLSNLDVHQAYLKVDNLFKLPVSLKAGRMEASYGTQRIMSVNNWNNIGRSFDGVTLQVDFCLECELKVDLFAFRVTESGLEDDSLDENVLGAFSELDFFEGHKLQPFIVYYSSTSASYPFNVFSPGFNLIGRIGNFDHQAEFIYQFNQGNEEADVDLSAFLVAYNATYTFDSAVKPYVSGGVDYLSGDDDLTDNEYKEFNRLFGAGHKYLGYMDLFPKNTYGVGLMDMHVKAGLKPDDKLTLRAALHIFNSAEDYELFGGSSSKSFGTEIDLTGSYKYNSYLTFEGGASLFAPGDIFKETMGEDMSTWFYLMSTVNL